MENTPKKAAHEPQMLGGFELFKPSIDIIKLNLKTFLTLLAVPIIALAPSYILTDSAVQDFYGTSAGMSLWFAGMVALLLVNPALIYTQIKSTRKEVVQPGEAFQTGLKYFWRILGAALLSALIYVVALIALIVPFFFIYRRYMLVPYYIIGRDMSITEAFKKSAEDSITHKSPMWGLVGVSILVQLPSFIPIIGWIPGTLYSCAPAYRYKEITTASKSGKKKEKEEVLKKGSLDKE